MSGTLRNFLRPGSALLVAAALWAAPPPARRSGEWLRKRRAAPPGVSAAARRAEAVRELNGMRPRAGDTQPWQMIGPQPTVTTLPAAAASGAPLSSGRVTAIAVDPKRTAVVYAGTAEGGVWKTTDAGKVWTPTSDDQASLSIGALAIDPSNSDTVYAATGEANYYADGYSGVGILKTTDGGAHWTLAGSPGGARGGFDIGALAVHAGGKILLAAAIGPDAKSSGIWRSTDGAATWTQVLSGADGTAVLFDPVLADDVYAALGDPWGAEANGIYRSLDGGVTWSKSQGLEGKGAGRIALTISHLPQPVLYAVASNAKAWGPLGVFTSTDRGQSWTQLPGSPPQYCYYSCRNTTTIQMNPMVPQLLVVAGESIQISRDSGAHWESSNIGANSVNVHADVHALTFVPDGSRLYVGSDGGIVAAERLAFTPAGSVEWHNLNDTLALTQFYPGCSLHPENSAFVVCGTQDNGVQIYSGGKIWQMIYSGDGGYTAIDDAEPALYYLGNTQEVDVQRTAPFGNVHSPFPVMNGLPSYPDPNNFPCSDLPPLVTDPANPLRLYWGCLQVFRTEDSGGVWKPVGPALTSKDGPIQAMAVAPSDSGRIYFGTEAGKVWTTADGSTWADVSDALPNRIVTAVAVDGADARTAYVAFGGFADKAPRGHLFATSDAGAHWTDISGNLPDIPVNTIAVDTASAGLLYIGTDIGVFVREGNGWVPVGVGLPRVAVLDLKIQQPFRLLRAATHGRSMWEYQLPAPKNTPPSISGFLAEPGAMTVIGSGFAADAVVRWNGSPRQTVGTNSGLRATLRANDAVGAGRASIAVCSVTVGCTHAFNVNLGDPPVITAVVNAANPAGGQALAPNTLASIFGENLSPVEIGDALSYPPLSLGGTTVELRDVTQHFSIQVPLFYVSPGQINFLVPGGVTPGDLFVAGVVNGRRFAQQSGGAYFTDLSPGIFSVIDKGSDTVAGRGDAALVLASGLGPTRPTKNALGDQETYVTPQVTIGGAQAQVTSSVLTSFPGLYFVRIVIPTTVQGTDLPVVLYAGGVASNTVRITVQ